jgi:hypothetical protein
MKNILNEELGRIQYLFEHKRGVVISEQKTDDPKKNIKQRIIDAGGNWEQVKKEFGSSGSLTDNMRIINAMNSGWRPGQPIPEKYSNTKADSAGTNTTTGTTTNTNTGQIPEIATATGINVQSAFDLLAEEPEKMNKQPFNTFAYFVKIVPGADPSLPKTGKVDGVASTLKPEDFKVKYTNYETYRFVPTPEGGFKPGTDVESGAVYGKETITKVTEVPTENQPEKTIQQIEYDSQSQWCKDNTVTADPYLEKCFSGTVKAGQPIRTAEDAMARIGREQGFQYKRDQNFDQATGIIEQVRGPKALTATQRKERENKKPKNMVGGMTRDEFDKDTTKMIATDQKLEGIGPNERQYFKDLLKNTKGSVLGLGEAGDLNRAQRRSLRDAKRQLNSEPNPVGETKYVYNPEERKYKSWVVATA